jgi:hypothetical protein
MGLTTTQQVGIVLSIVLLIVIGVLVWWFFFKKSDTPTPTSGGDKPPVDCVEQIKKSCKLSDTLTCEDYATCLQSAAYTSNVVTGCTTDWLDKNCADFKPGPGSGQTTSSTYTWTGEYFKISALGGGGLQSSLPNVDLSVINKVVLNIDFSSNYVNNDTGSEITFSMNLGKTVAQLVSEYSFIHVTPPDGIKNLPPNPSDTTGGAVILGSVIIGDSTINPGQSVNFTFNTDTNMRDKKETFTLVFIKQ